MTADRGELSGIGRALKQAFAVDDPPDREIDGALARTNGSYAPDGAADARCDQLLKRLKRLPWGDGREA